MIRNNLKIAWRNIARNKFASLINIGGLSAGMAVAILIGLWIRDELSFNAVHTNYDRIAAVKQQSTHNGKINTGNAVPMPLEQELRTSYGDDFKHIVTLTIPWTHILSAGNVKVSYTGSFIGKEAPEMFSLKMEEGSLSGLSDPSSVLLSHAAAVALFGKADPMGKLVTIDNEASFKVTGVYEDLPLNSSLNNLAFMAPWEYYRTSAEWLVNRAAYDWNDNFLLMYVELNEDAEIASIGEKIKDIKRSKISSDYAELKPAFVLHPMRQWHLYSRFTNGVITGGAIEYVRLFAIIGVFVLLLACINFMNLSTARSGKRAKETGIRKAIGSPRSQLIVQFYCESLFVALIAFIVSLLLVSVALPFFNDVAAKQLRILWMSPVFWLAGLGFTVFTGLIAGSYPALYLSSFQPVKTLKGTFKAGRFATAPRKALVVVQFAVSVILIIGTIIVFQQIQFAKDRPVGYDRSGLLSIETATSDLHDHFNAVKDEMIKSGAITDVAESSSPTTGVNNNRNDVVWEGKDPASSAYFAAVRISMEYGKTVGWQFTQGRDFSSALRTDSMSVVLNESALRYMALREPLNQTVRMGKRDLKIIGIIEDMVMESPYEPVKPAIFYITKEDFGYLNVRINPTINPHDAIKKAEAVCEEYSPAEPFSFKFADDEYGQKFVTEERTGKLAGFFSVLAILISCVGLFGMASFMAEQRVKEIGIRKVMGASVFTLWRMMSADFVRLIVASLFISIPAAIYFSNDWLKQFDYHAGLSSWIFIVTGAGAIAVTLLTVSYQSIRAARTNPVKSLRE